MYFYNARWYDAALGRFVQADTIVPDVYDVSLSALSVSFVNPAFLEEVGRENRWRASQDTSRLQPLLTRSEKPRGLGIVQWFRVSPASPSLDKAGAVPSTSSSQLPCTGPGDPQNLNRFTYVSNNPLTYIDPSGYWTFGISLSVSLMAVIGLRGDLTLTVDGKENVGLIGSLGGAGYTAAGYNAGLGIQVTSVPTIDDLAGWSVQFGGSAGVPLGGVFAELDFMENGIGLNVAAGSVLDEPFQFEVHGGAKHSWILWRN